MRIFFLACASMLLLVQTSAQNAAPAANKFISSLDSAQRLRAVYSFDADERYNFHFFPKDNRKGVMVNDLTPVQKELAFALVRVCLSEHAITKVKEIMQLDNVLKAMEHRKPEDHFRDTGKYYFTVFGVPGDKNIWGWRLEGHHITFNFSADKAKIVSGTPGFLGSNPGIVQDGPQKGEQVLKEEADAGFNLLHSFTPEQFKMASIDTLAPNEIITFVNRKAMLLHPDGIKYTDLNDKQKEQLLQLVRLYINRYTRLFADKMLKEIEKAG